MPEDAEHVEVYRGYRIVIEQDIDPVNPREEYDNFGNMICFHRKYKLGDDHVYSDPASFVADITNKSDDELSGTPNEMLGDGKAYRIVWLPLYLYDHSGITMKTSPFSCPWDSGQVGVIYVTYDEILKAFQIEPLDPKTWEPNDETRAKVITALEAEVQTYDCYLRGEVLGYHIFAPDDEAQCVAEDQDPPSSDDDEFWMDTDEESCLGFYGKEYTIQSAKEAIDALVDEG